MELRFQFLWNIVLYSIGLNFHWDFHDSSVGKESACNAGVPGSIPGLRSAGDGIGYQLQYSWASLVAPLVKNLPEMQETWVRSLGWEDPLEKGKAIHSSIWPREFHGLYSPWGHKELDKTELLSLHLLPSPVTYTTANLTTSVLNNCNYFWQVSHKKRVLTSEH